MLRLTDYIAAAGGWLPMDKMMELALYHPSEGYYSASIQNIGPRGDFSTTATLSPILAKAIVAKWKEACKEFGQKLPFLEIGAGNASLAMAIAEELGFWKRLTVDYIIVESSANLRDLQHLALGGFASIYPDIQRALKACHGKAFIFSNELVDAFPARVFEFTAEGWQEVGLSVKEGKLVEVCRTPEHLPSSEVLEYDTQIGQRIEIHESYHKWFSSWLPSWQLGVMTTIDYGDEFQKLYVRRPHGTMRAYYKHRLFTGMDVYANLGKMDITCDVNFSDLLSICRQCLGDEISLCTQRDYLLPYATGSLQDEFLTAEQGAGSEFKVLIHKRPPLKATKL
jgi:SAM-dependent MidA family methyltransferase